MCGVPASDLHFPKLTLAAVWGILEGQSTMGGKHQEEREASGLAQVVMVEVERRRGISAIF